MKNRTILITGGAGFIGAHYVHMVAQDHPNWTIRVLDLLTYCGNMANLEGLEGQIDFTKGDIADPETVNRVMQGCDAVVHFAAESHVDRSPIDSRPFIHTNVIGTQVLLDACRRHGLWSIRHKRRVCAWFEHLLRAPDTGTQSWASVLVKYKGDQWLQRQRSLHPRGRTGTRSNAGYVAQRWETGARVAASA